MSQVKRIVEFREKIFKEWTIKFWEFITENRHKILKWIFLSENPNITFDIIKDNLDYPGFGRQYQEIQILQWK